MRTCAQVRHGFVCEQMVAMTDSDLLALIEAHLKSRSQMYELISQHVVVDPGLPS